MGWPPRELIIITLATASTLPGDAFLYTILPTVWPELGLELWMVGVLLSANRFVRLLTNPFSGWCVDRIGLRIPFLASVFLSVVTTASYGIRAGFLTFLGARLLWGLCWSFLRLGGYLTALNAGTTGQRGYYLGFVSAVGYIGMIMGALLGGFLADMLGYQITIWIFTGFGLISAIVLLQAPTIFNLSEKPYRLKDDRPEADEYGIARQNRKRWFVYVGTFINGVAGSNLVVSTIAIWLIAQYGETIHIASFTLGVASVTGLLLSGRFFIDVVWAPSAGHLADRFNRFTVMSILCLILVCMLIGISLPLSFMAIVTLAFGIFFTGTAIRVMLDTIIGDLVPPQNRARMMSWYSNWSDLGSASGPFLAYQVVGYISIPWVYRSGAVLLATTGIVIMLWLRWQGRSTNSGLAFQ